MSKAEQTRTKTVYLSRKADTNKHYHEDHNCYNLPERHREIEFAKIKGHYDACAACADASGQVHNSNQADYECAGCHSQERLGATGVRTLHACHECGDVTSWERIENVR